MGFTWYATAFDTDDVTYRISLLAAMLTVLAIAVNIDGVKDGDTVGFVVSYVILQAVVVGLFMRARHHAHQARSFTTRYATGYALGGAMWLISLVFPSQAQYWIWGAAMAVLMITPMIAVRAYRGQPFDSSHIPERYGLFTIIVLGESVVAVAAGISSTGWHVAPALTAATGFGIAACIWWVYFDFVESTVVRRDAIVRAFVWGYGHLGIYVGIASAAVGIGLIIEAVAHDAGLSSAERGIFLGGLASYLLTIAVLRYNSVLALDRTVSVRLAAAATIFALIFVGGWVSAALLVPLAFALVGAQTLFEVVQAGPKAASLPASEEH